MFIGDWAVFWYHDCSINWLRVVIMTHQNLSLGKCWKLFWATLRDQLDISEIIDISTCEDMVSFLPLTLIYITKREYGFLFDQKGKYNRVLIFIPCSFVIYSRPGQYQWLVYTKTVDSVKRARWLARQTPNILCYLPPSNSRENGVPVCGRDKWRNHPKLSLCGVYYLTVLVYTKTTIHLSVGG